MTDSPSSQTESKDNFLTAQKNILLYTALTGAIATLLIGFVSLIRRKPAGFVENFSEKLAVDPSKSGGGTISTITIPASNKSEVKPRIGDESGAQGFTDQMTAPQPVSTTRWSLATKYIVGVGLFLALLFVVYLSRSTLSMIIFAALLAFVVQPAVGFFQRRFKMKRGSSVGLAYLLVVAVMIIVPLLVIPAIIQSINGVLAIDWEAKAQEMALVLQSTADSVSATPVIGATMAATLDSLAQILSGTASLEAPTPIVVDVSVESIGSQLAQTLGRLARILGPLISAIVSLIFMLLISLRMSLAVDEIKDAYPTLFPSTYNSEISKLVERIIKVWTSFLSGQLSLMVIMGFLVYLLNVLLGTPYPLFLGFLAGLLEIIPSLGPVLATIPAVILALVAGSSYLPVSNLMFAIIVILGYVLLSAFENQILVPKVLGDAVDLHPLVVIIGCVVGGATFGLLGVFLATPVISTGKEIFGYLYNKILEPPVEPEPPEEKRSLMGAIKGLTQRVRLPFRRRENKKPSTGEIEEPVG